MFVHLNWKPSSPLLPLSPIVFRVIDYTCTFLLLRTWLLWLYTLDLVFVYFMLEYRLAVLFAPSSTLCRLLLMKIEPAYYDDSTVFLWVEVLLARNTCKVWSAFFILDCFLRYDRFGCPWLRLGGMDENVRFLSKVVAINDKSFFFEPPLRILPIKLTIDFYSNSAFLFLADRYLVSVVGICLLGYAHTYC